MFVSIRKAHQIESGVHEKLGKIEFLPIHFRGSIRNCDKTSYSKNCLFFCTSVTSHTLLQWKLIPLHSIAFGPVGPVIMQGGSKKKLIRCKNMTNCLREQINIWQEWDSKIHPSTVYHWFEILYGDLFVKQFITKHSCHAFIFLLMVYTIFPWHLEWCCKSNLVRQIVSFTLKPINITNETRILWPSSDGFRWNHQWSTSLSLFFVHAGQIAWNLKSTNN